LYELGYDGPALHCQVHRTGANCLYMTLDAASPAACAASVPAVSNIVCTPPPAPLTTCAVTCNATTTKFPPTKVRRLLNDHGYEGADTYLEDCCSGNASTVFCDQAFPTRPGCNDTLSSLHAAGYAGPALTCTPHTTDTGCPYVTLDATSADSCASSAVALTPILCSNKTNETLFDCVGNMCVLTNTSKGADLSSCKSVCGSSAGNFACVLGRCVATTDGGTLAACQSVCK
jgi:hypothetical protein